MARPLNTRHASPVGPTITYRPRPAGFQFRRIDGSYHVAYPDGFSVVIPKLSNPQDNDLPALLEIADEAHLQAIQADQR